MEEIKLDKAYWDSRYQSDNTRWDIGYVSPAIKNWFDFQENKDLSILIPGAGSGYEVSYAHQLGLKTYSTWTYHQKLSNYLNQKIHHFQKIEFYLQTSLM